MPRYLFIFFTFSVVMAAVVIGLDGRPGLSQGGAGDGATSEPHETLTPYVLPQAGPFHPEQIEIGNSKAINDWYRSPHADAAAEAFRHWDSEEAINPVCSVCHSGEGFRSFHGLDGSAPGVPAEPVNTGGVVDCGTCHNAGLAQVTEVQFPSGLNHPVVGVEAACMTCHRGRTAGVTVSAAIASKPVDELDPSLRFINPHYATAAATWLGGYGGAGYQYQGKSYTGRFFHARPVATCVSCHQPHTLEVAFEPCLTCHQANSLPDIRIARQSYDGSGNTSVGIRSDIAANAALLLDMIEAYAAEVIGVPVVYDANSHPYFFTDANGDGVVDRSGDRSVAYAAWSPRMLRAAYNWKLVSADPGAYAHNPYYALELLYDAIEDLAEPLAVDMDALKILR